MTKSFLVLSAILVLLASCSVFEFPHNQANAVPVNYNITALTVPFSTFTKNTTNNAQTLMVESGFNGTITSVYEGHQDNLNLNWKLGSHPTLPLSFDTKTNSSASGSTSTTQTLGINVASGHNNRVLIVAIGMNHTGDTNHNNIISSVSLGSNAFSRSVNKTVTCSSSVCDSEIWVLYNPPEGVDTITITPVSTNVYNMIFGAYSLYNVRGLAPIGVSTTGTATSTTPSTTLTPTFSGTSWLLDNYFSTTSNVATASTNTVGWKASANSSGSASPISLSWNFSNSTNWTTSGTDQSISANKLNWNADRPATTAQGMYYDLGNSLNDNGNWKLRFHLHTTTVTNGGTATIIFMGIGSTASNDASSGNQNFLGFRMAIGGGVTNHLDPTVAVGTTLAGATQTTGTPTPSAGTDFYIMLNRTSTSTFYVTLYSDSSYSTVVSQTSGTATGATNLRYIKFNSGDFSSATTSVLNGYVDVMSLYQSAFTTSGRGSGGSQYFPTPTINSANTLTWTITSSTWVDSAIELVPIQNQNNYAFYLSQMPFGNPTGGSTTMSTNGSSIYYAGRGSGTYGNVVPMNHIDTLTGVESHDFSVTGTGSSTLSAYAFGGQYQKWLGFYSTFPVSYLANPTSGNTSGSGSSIGMTDQYIHFASGNGALYTSNTTSVSSVSASNGCSIFLNSTSVVTPIDTFVCNLSLPSHAFKFWYGMNINRIGGYYSNSTLSFFSTLNSSPYKSHLTIPATIYGIPSPDVKLIGHWDGVDYLISYNSGNTFYYTPMGTITTLLAQNRAIQSYYILPQYTSSLYPVLPSSINPSVTVAIYGPGMNTTMNAFGTVTLPSGYTMRLENTFPNNIRTIDPRWTNIPASTIPAEYTSSSLFAILLTVSNAPIDAGLWVQNPSQIIEGQPGTWSVVQLDSTHSAEFDIPITQCANIYIASISTYPFIYNYEGNVCATGTNIKTMAYVNTLPISFWTSKYSATHTYTPSTNALSVTTRATTGPFTETILIKNNNGTTVQNYTGTVNGTIDTQTFNVTSVGKPLTLEVDVNGNPIYSAFLGSSVSFASVSSFFATYFSYHGFNLLSLIPIIFAGMFTRNNVGIGAVAVVLLIGSLNFFSLVVVPEGIITIMMFVSLIGLIAYRVILY